MRLTEEKADKQTITDATDASQIQKSNQKKAVRTGDRWKCSSLLKKLDKDRFGKSSSNVDSVHVL